MRHWGMGLTTRMLTPQTWDDFATLGELNNGIWGGCWCTLHPESVGHGREHNREPKRQHVLRGTIHQVFVYDGERCGALPAAHTNRHASTCDHVVVRRIPDVPVGDG
jgi:hypothetical protein